MYRNNSVAVVVPAYNEEKLIGRVIETMPDYVDHIIVVNDRSKDKTQEIVQSYVEKSDGRVVLINLQQNRGVGGAIARGFKWARDNRIDATATMDGDAQMDPNDLSKMLDPIIDDESDYTKGNRLISGEAWRIIPRARYMGNAALSLLTKIASGYWQIADSQTGFTVSNLKVLDTIDLNRIYKSYGMPNDMLVKLNIYNFRVTNVEIKPIYNIGEKSGFKPLLVIPKYSRLLWNLFCYRMVQKYIIRDFHPLVFFYSSGFFLGIVGIGLTIRLIIRWIQAGSIPSMNALAVFFSFIACIQMLFFAMWFDMDANKHLNKAAKPTPAMKHDEENS